MPVIINDFEVMVDAPAEANGRQPAAPQLSQPTPMPKPRPEHVARILRYLAQRRARVAAD